MTATHFPASAFRVTYEGAIATIWRRTDNALIARCHPDYVAVIAQALENALRGGHREGRL